MKHIITAAVICAALATPALAEKHVAEHCEVIADLAEGLMGARQAGASLSAVMSIAAAEPQVRELVEAMILDAWSEPRWRTDESQSRAVADFRDRMHLLCLRGA
jgi:hypothetical protein